MSKRQSSKLTKAPHLLDADAIITMDPAAVSNSGICLRPVHGLITPTKHRVKSPEYWVSDSVWNTQMHDDLARMIAKWVPRGGRVVFASTSTAFQGTAMSIGRAIGCIEGMLHDLNVFDVHSKVEAIQDVTWRKTMFGPKDWARIKGIEDSKQRRVEWKKLAVETVLRRYTIDCDDNAAEAILLNDHVALWREDMWKAGGERRSFNPDMWKKGGYGAQRTA